MVPTRTELTEMPHVEKIHPPYKILVSACATFGL